MMTLISFILFLLYFKYKIKKGSRIILLKNIRITRILKTKTKKRKFFNLNQFCYQFNFY